MPIELKAVSYTYAPDTPYSARAISNVNLKINDGEFVGIIGRTGCGKSTLIQLLDGLLTPSQGVVFLDDEDINSKKYNRAVLRKRVGVVFQFPEYQLFETTVQRDIAFALKHSGMSKAEINSAVQEALELVGFNYDKVKDKSPLSFSGGERRKLAIAGVLVSKPDYLILDEPAAGLDPEGKAEFLQLLTTLNSNGTTVIMVSHNFDVLAEYAKRIVLMQDGSIIKDSSATEILSDCSLLDNCGLKSNQVQNIIHMLREKNIAVKPDIIKYNQLIDNICDIYGRDNNEVSS